MELKEIRERIDGIDRGIMDLLEERMELSIRSERFKQRIEDPQREKEIMARIESLNCDLLEAEFRRKILTAIMDEGKRLQKEHARLVAFQGEHGAYGEMAARRMAPEGAYIPCAEFSDVFRGVEAGYFDLGAVPVENLLEGSVSQPNNLLIDTKLRVVGEVNLPVNHCLVAPKGTDHRQVRMVYSHPQALAQCHGFIVRNKLDPRPYYDTAGAAKMIAKEAPFGAAAIASRLAAELYELDVIKTGIDDEEENLTRFLMISREPAEGPGDKCSIVFATKHEAGALYSVLRLFAEAGVNLTRISSAPRPSDRGNYIFFCDFEGSEKDESIKLILSKVTKIVLHFNFLGCYTNKL